MGYVGNSPALKYTSFAVQHFTTSATTGYTLDHAVANENDIRLVINNVVQQPGSGKAYTASGTTLTLSAATSGTDTMYCVFLGKAVQTVVPGQGSVTGSTLADDVISAQSALGAVPADTDEFLISDAGVLKKVDYSYLKHTYIDWQTSSIKTSGFTAVAGQGYFCNTTSGGFTVTLPAGVAGQQIAVKDYARTFASGNLTIASNGSEKIQGSTSNSELKTAGGVAVLTYVDSTKGWLYTEQDNVSSLQAPAYVTATGGTITTSGDYKIHTFLASSTFNVSNPGNSGGSDEVEVLVVGGGGGVVNGTITSTLTATNYTITVGAGGAGTSGAGGNNGVDSYFAQGAAAALECKGAGGGRGGDEGTANGSAGGSGGGAFGGGSAGASSGNVAAAGTTAYGNAGGTGTSDLGAGGGGANGTGGTISSGSVGGAGGAGKQINIDGNNYYWAGGGGGSAWTNGTGGAGGTGGGGGGTSYYTSCAGGSGGAGGGTAINAGGAGQGDDNAQSGSGGTNSGGGGGGAGNYWGACSQQAGNGGSGIVIVKYKFQN